MSKETWELLLTNAVRGLAARFGQLLEVVMVNVVFNAVVFGACIYALSLVASAEQIKDSWMRPFFALCIIAGAMCLTAKGADLIHGRKWLEYNQMEQKAQAQDGAIENPSVDVSKKSRKSILVINVLGIVVLALPVIVIGSYQLLTRLDLLPALGLIVPTVSITFYAAYIWLSSSK